MLLAPTALLIARADRFQERAEDAARQSAQVQEVMRRTRSGQEMWSTLFRSGVPSPPAWRAFTGERALCYRTPAQERRILLSTLGTFSVLLVITLVLSLFLATYVWIPTVLMLISAPIAFGAADGLAAELDHYHLGLAPLRPLPSLVWVSAIPVSRTVALSEILWLPTLATPDISVGIWISVAIPIPFLIALAATAGSFAIATAEGALFRAALGIGLAALSLAPTVVLIAYLPVPDGIVGTLFGAVLLAESALWVVSTSRLVWVRQ